MLEGLMLTSGYVNEDDGDIALATDFYELTMDLSISQSLDPKDLEEFFINWKNRTSKKPLSFIIAYYTLNDENMKVIEYTYEEGIRAIVWWRKIISSKGEECHVRHGTTKPEDFAVRDENNGQVLEYGVNGDGKVFERPGRGIDHADEEEGDGEPYFTSKPCRCPRIPLVRTLLGLIAVEIPVCDDTRALAARDGNDADNRL